LVARNTKLTLYVTVGSRVTHWHSCSCYTLILWLTCIV